jgi:hypothetical protein
VLLAKLNATGFGGELSLERINPRPQGFQVDWSFFPSLKFGDRHLQFGELFPPTPQHANSLPNICLEFKHLQAKLLVQPPHPAGTAGHLPHLVGK